MWVISPFFTTSSKVVCWIDIRKTFASGKCGWTLSAPKAILSFLKTIQTQVNQLVTSCLAWNRHCLAFSYKTIPKPLQHEDRDVRLMYMEESTSNNSGLKEVNVCATWPYLRTRHCVIIFYWSVHGSNSTWNHLVSLSHQNMSTSPLE